MTLIFIDVTPPLAQQLLLADTPHAHKSEIELETFYQLVSRKVSQKSLSPEQEQELMKQCQIVRRERDWEAETKLLAGLSEIEILRLRAEEKRYQRSIANVAGGLGGTGSIGGTRSANSFGSALREASDSAGFAAHFVICFIGAFFCGYFMCEYYLAFSDPAAKALCGGACAFVTMLLEVALMLVREQKRASRERKGAMGQSMPGVAQSRERDVVVGAETLREGGVGAKTEVREGGVGAETLRERETGDEEGSSLSKEEGSLCDIRDESLSTSVNDETVDRDESLSTSVNDETVDASLSTSHGDGAAERQRRRDHVGKDGSTLPNNEDSRESETTLLGRVDGALLHDDGRVVRRRYR